MSRSKNNGTLPLFDRSPAFFATDPPKLRPYQSRAIQNLRNHVRGGKKRILLVAPVAAGKMTMIASIIRTSSVPVVFVCHLRELIDQCVEQLQLVGISNVGVIRGDDDRSNPTASVQVASIQTLSRRDKPHAGIVLVDEAHRSVSDSYDKILDHYAGTGSIILGFTATPTRLDGRPLGNRYEVLEIVCTYAELIKDGFISEPFCYSSPANLDLSRIKITGSDYDEGELGDLMRDSVLIGRLLEHWQRLANKYRTEGGGLTTGQYRRTIIFAVNVAHSVAIRDLFASAGIKIAHLDGTTPEKERRHMIRALGEGDIDAITNVGLLLEGTDIVSAKCVVHARPTQSLVIHRQSCGRIMRPWHPGCPKGCRLHPTIEPLILDHANNITVHGFPHEDLHWSLTEKPIRGEKRIATRICKNCFAYLPAFKRLCPYCGFDAPPEQHSDLPRETEEQLQRLAITSPEEMRFMYFNTISQVAKAKGYRPGFAAARYKDRYGSWPPWEWSDGLKARFASDPEWQANFQKNVQRKEKAALAKQAKELAKIEGKNPDGDEENE